MYALSLNELLYGKTEIYDEEMVSILASSDDASYKYYGLYLSYHNAEKKSDEERKDIIRQEMSSIEREASSYIRKNCVID
jgi:hypothetical protein